MSAKHPLEDKLAAAAKPKPATATSPSAAAARMRAKILLGPSCGFADRIAPELEALLATQELGDADKASVETALGALKTLCTVGKRLLP